MATASAADVARIEALSGWLGFAHPSSRSAKLVITRGAGSRFSREVVPGGFTDELPAGAVDGLLSALSRPPVARLDPALFPDLPEPVLLRHYESMWTDDYPQFLLRVTFDGGRCVSVHTKSSHAFMLPLSVSEASPGGAFETFDPHLSRAVAALLPDDFLNGRRLAGDDGMLRYELDQYARATAGEGQVDRDRRKAGEKPKKRKRVRPDALPARLLRRSTSTDDVRRLLAGGANPSVADEHGQTALMLAAFPPPDFERFRVLAAGGADVEARRRDGATGLHLACAGGSAEAAAEWLKAGADVHARLEGGATALMLGARWPDVVEALVAGGAEVNAVDDDGDCALVYAVLDQSGICPKPQLRAIRRLIEAGADVNLRDREALTPLGHARRKLAEERVAEEVSAKLCAAAGEPPPGDIPPEYEDTFGWRPVRMAEEVVRLLESAGGRD